MIDLNKLQNKFDDLFNDPNMPKDFESFIAKKRNMIENTLENKAKFFFIYYGQRIWRYPHSNGVTTLLYIDANTVHDKIYVGFRGHLELRSLSSITDEDAIELVKTHGYIENQLTEENGRSLVNSIIKGTDMPFFYIKKEKFGHTIDYLRSRGYALPYMGASVETMVEWGWIKLKKD